MVGIVFPGVNCIGNILAIAFDTPRSKEETQQVILGILVSSHRGGCQFCLCRQEVAPNAPTANKPNTEAGSGTA
ncbi:hypothetical protein MiSe_62140 [Microseira wollei NIES-4236]|uniref:Uncharacterized protein n=1 Tax=Microseira wollei NIES-4236 TaxID=2530354 RepID=A0AAV3XEN1_9CYAN|nr:hypothetical protein MiSe_62140 [Microseira wollei NIES-4236]